MSKKPRTTVTTQVGFVFDEDPVVVAGDVVAEVGASGLRGPDAPPTLDAPLPTMETSPQGEDRFGPRCIEILDDEPAPTIMAGGIGGSQVVNLGGYDVLPTGTPSDPCKPPYRVPLMSEINTFEKNGLVMVSTFSGCGGSCLGFKMAGYDVLWASEFVPAAQDTYRANHPSTHLDAQDIRQVTAATIRAVIGDREIDVFEGSPPCASFSTAGKGAKGWNKVRKYSDTEQRTDDLFGEYVRLLAELKPRAFVAENVAGMVRGASKGHFRNYLEMFRGLPYRVEAQTLDASDLGVPQRRVRLIFVGIRNDVPIPKLARLFPTKMRYRNADGALVPLVYTVRDAIPWIGKMQDQYGAFTEKGKSSRADKTVDVDVDSSPSPTVRASLNDQFRGEFKPVGELVVQRLGERFDKEIGDEPVVLVDPQGQHDTQIVQLDEPMPTVRAQGAMHQTSVVSRRIHHDESVGDHVGASLEGYAVGTEWDKLKPGESSDKYFNLVRTDPDQPCQTVTAAGATTSAIGAPGGVASITHPYERRKFTLAELRRICGFPDDFILTGSYAQGWERLGRAVPPPMMRAVAENLRAILKPEVK